jgi:type II secretory pathway predicted ATPase ExeA
MRAESTPPSHAGVVKRGGEPPQQRPHTLEDLLRAWGMHRAPFSADEKSAQIFPAACHSEALELLHTTAALRGLMLLTGNPGTGKSTLLKSWIASLEPKRLRAIP